MIYCVVSEEYSFFTTEKNKIKEKCSLTSEYIIDDADLLIESIELFSQGGFFGGVQPLLVFKDIPNLGDFEYVKKVVLMHNIQGSIIVLYLPVLTKDIQVFVQDHEGVFIEQKKVVIPKKEVTPFGLTDLFMKRDKKNAWLTFVEIQADLEIGQIVSSLFWMAKTMLLVKRASSIADTGLKPFVYNKTKQFLGLWSEDEIEKLLLSILKITAEEQFDEDAQVLQVEKLIFSL